MIIGPTDVVRDPTYIPHGMPDDRHITFRRVTASAVREASFLDGRVEVGEAAGTCSIAGLQAALQNMPQAAALPTIFHVSFCGSTLLSRLLDVPGHTLVYREPAIQIALADRCAAGMPVDQALAIATQLLGRPVAGATAIVKPTNWANVLLPAWTRAGGVTPLFITMQPRAFLIAVFRGGRDRIAFTIRAAEHFAKVVADGPEMIATAVGADNVALAQAARLILVALELQLRLFAAARAQLDPNGCCTLDEQDIRRDPTGAARSAAVALGLAGPAPLIGGDNRAHAKDPSQQFSLDTEERANRMVLAHHAALFDAALIWAAGRGFFVV